MPPNKTNGLDGVEVKILKVAAPAIAPSLCRHINYCTDTSTFPALWKYVTPVYKGHGSKDDMSNYRPISILPLLSKISEKHIHYVKKNELLYQLQSAAISFHGDSSYSSCRPDFTEHGQGPCHWPDFY